MDSPKRPPRPDLTPLAGLRAAPGDHHLFQALRLVEAAHPDRPRLGQSRRPGQDPVRLGQAAELAFARTTIAGVAQTAQGPDKLTQHAFGLFGPNGPLPLHLTEYARDRQRNHNDPTLVAFADMFHHRALSLLYRAWASGQPALSFDRAEDGFGDMVAALSGHAGPSMEGRDAMPDVAKRHFAALLGSAPKSEEGLRAILTALFDAPVAVESFVASWLTLEPEDRGRLGGAALGGTANLGRRVRSRAAKIRVRIGPLCRADFDRLLPGTHGMKRLAAVLRNYVGDTLDWEAVLILRQADVPRAVLGRAASLGRTGWIGRRKDVDAADLTLTRPAARAL